MAAWEADALALEIVAATGRSQLGVRTVGGTSLEVSMIEGALLAAPGGRSR